MRLSSRRSTLSLLALVLLALACGQESLPEQPPSDLQFTRQAHSTNKVLILRQHRLGRDEQPRGTGRAQPGL